MADWIANGETVLSLRNKLMNLQSMFGITHTNAVITAGAVTSIPVVVFDGGVLYSGDVIYIEDNETYEMHPLTLTADYTGGASITVSSHTFLTNIAVGASIYFSLKRLITISRPV